MNLVGGELRLGPTTIPSQAFFQRDDFPVDLDSGFEMEAAFRIVSSTEMQLPGGPLRYGVQLSIVDDAGNTCAAQFSEDSVALLNSPNDPTSAANTATAQISLKDRNVIARVTTDATTLRLFVDGALVVSLNRGPALTFPKNFYFGEGTGSGSAELFVSYVRASSSSPLCTPTSISHVASGCAGLGTLSVSGILQPGQGSTQTFTMPGTSSDGLPVFLFGSYSMQTPYCSAGCRLGMRGATALGMAGEFWSVPFPAAVAGWPFAFQGVRILGTPGPCSTPFVHQLTDVCVVTL